MNLLTLQNSFRAWLTVECPEAERSLAHPGAEGLGVYLNNYRGQLMECLSKSFEVVRAWLGDAAFEAAAATHVDATPPHSWTLDAYALDFPETLERLYPDDPEVGDLARLERALEVAFVGPDAEPIDPSRIADVDWDSAILHFLPTLTLVPVTTNAGAIWAAIANGETPPPAELLAERAAVAVWRRGHSPEFRTIGKVEMEGLERALRGASFGSVCGTFLEHRGEETGATAAGQALGQWMQDGLVSRIE